MGKDQKNGKKPGKSASKGAWKYILFWVAVLSVGGFGYWKSMYPSDGKKEELIAQMRKHDHGSVRDVPVWIHGKVPGTTQNYGAHGAKLEYADGWTCVVTVGHIFNQQNQVAEWEVVEDGKRIGFLAAIVLPSELDKGLKVPWTPDAVFASIGQTPTPIGLIALGGQAEIKESVQTIDPIVVSPLDKNGPEVRLAGIINKSSAFPIFVGELKDGGPGSSGRVYYDPKGHFYLISGGIDGLPNMVLFSSANPVDFKEK